MLSSWWDVVSWERGEISVLFNNILSIRQLCQSVLTERERGKGEGAIKKCTKNEAAQTNKLCSAQ